MSNQESTKLILLNTYGVIDTDTVEIGLVYNTRGDLLAKDSLVGLEESKLTKENLEINQEQQYSVRVLGDTRKLLKKGDYLSDTEVKEEIVDISTKLSVEMLIQGEVEFSKDKVGGEGSQSKGLENYSFESLFTDIDNIIEEDGKKEVEQNVSVEDYIKAQKDLEAKLEVFKETGEMEDMDEYKVLKCLYTIDYRLTNNNLLYSIPVREEDLDYLIYTKVLYNLTTGEYKYQGFKKVSTNEEYRGYGNELETMVTSTYNLWDSMVRVLDELYSSQTDILDSYLGLLEGIDPETGKLYNNYEEDFDVDDLDDDFLDTEEFFNTEEPVYNEPTNFDADLIRTNILKNVENIDTSLYKIDDVLNAMEEVLEKYSKKEDNDGKGIDE